MRLLLRFLKAFCLASACMVFPFAGSSAQGIDSELSINYEKPSQIKIVWQNAPSDLASKERIILPLTQKGFSLAILIEVAGVARLETTTYTLIRTQVQRKAEVDELISNFIKEANGRGKISVTISQTNSV